MNKISAISGNSGPKVRSDCEMVLELRDSGGIQIDIRSKVLALYGESIRAQCREILGFFGITDASLVVIDSGALPFVIAARAEAAIRQLVDTKLEFLPPMREDARRATTRDRFRFSRLYLPGNTPSMMINAGLHSADGIILDLEDSVAPGKKDEARILVRNALRQIGFEGSERMVRINQGERGITDLEYLIPHHVNVVLIPKTESAGAVRLIDARINQIREEKGLADPVYLMPIIETALGVERAFEIAQSSESVVALAIGLEDLTADLGVPRTVEGLESLYARTRIINAAKAAGIQPIDSVFSDVSDMEALRRSISISKSLGFEGMGCIHPRQIAEARKGFAPSREEIDKAKKIVHAFTVAEKEGLGVVALGTKMIDAPVVARARKTIDLALTLGFLSSDWMNEAVVEESN
jgi:citrate lyase subunit beta / citryl-CoA lyase